MFNQSGNVRHLYIAIFTYALALTNHWPLMILSTPALIVVVSPRTKLIMSFLRSPLFWMVSIILVAIGLSPYLTILNQPNPPISVFGGVNTFVEFLEYLARSVYSDDHVVAGSADRLQYTFWLLDESGRQFGLLGIPFLLLGFYQSARSQTMAINISLVLMYLSGTFALNLLLNFRFDFFWQAIFKPYPVISYLALAIWFAMGVRYSCHWLGERMRIGDQNISIIISVTVLVGVFAANFTRNNRANSVWVEQYGRSVLESLPSNAVFFLRGDFEYSVFGFLHQVMGVRPDIEMRSWDNLVFSNRLNSPAVSASIQQHKREQFLEHEVRPIFVISAALSPTVQLGGYYRYTPGEARVAERNPEMDIFLDYLLDLYVDGLITDPHEIYYAFYRLLNFSRQYVALALTQSDLSELEFQRLNRLQSTFPGKLATLETLLELNPGSEGKDVLIGFARSAEDQIPDFITNESLAVFYEFYGRALAMEPSDNTLAISYFEKSVETLPMNINTSLCPLTRLYEAELMQAKLKVILKQYPDLECH
jgi:hypothetical protein